MKEQQAKGHQHVVEFWGRFLPNGAVVMLVGEASAGKTVFLHRLSHALARADEFLGLKPPQPLRVLHVDLETPEARRVEVVEIIRPEPGWHFVKVEPSDLHSLLREAASQYQVIIVDSLQVASPVKDENDNGEANRQIGPFVSHARQSGATIVLSHNAGEGNPKEKFKARGATARVDRVDITINFDDLGEKKRRLKVVKTRYGNLGDTIEFEFAGELDYRLTKPAEQPSGKEGEMGTRIMRAMPQFGELGTPVTRKALADSLGVRLKKEGEPTSAEERCFDRALKNLGEARRLLHDTRGVYALPSVTDNADKPPDPREVEVSARKTASRTRDGQKDAGEPKKRVEPEHASGVTLEDLHNIPVDMKAVDKILGKARRGHLSPASHNRISARDARH